VLVFVGQVPVPADASKQQQLSVAASTIIGVGSHPSKLLGPQYNGSRTGLKEIAVHGVSLQQQQSRSISELLLPDGDASGAAALHSAYRVALEMPEMCVPGQPATYRWTLRNASSSEPITDLQLRNGTALRLFIASTDLSHLQQTAGNAEPSTAAGLGSSKKGTSSSIGGGASAYMRGSRAAAGAVTAEAAAGRTGSAGEAVQQQHPGGRRLLVPLAGHAALRRLQQAGSNASASDSLSSSSSRVGLFGPSVSAHVALPKYGTYLFVAEVMRGGDDLVVMPFHVACSAGDPQHESAAATARTSGAGSVVQQRPLRMLFWAVLVLVVQHLLCLSVL
jgi:hypothetical protein